MTMVSVFGVAPQQTPDTIGDISLFGVTVELATAGLLDMAGDGHHIRSTRSALTDLGRAVLEGKAHRARATGFDRWIGGTHLRAREGELWWYVDGRLERGPLPSA